MTDVPALPGADLVLPVAERAATLAHLAVCHAAANAVRAEPHVRLDAAGRPRAFVVLRLGSQEALIGEATALILLCELATEPGATFQLHAVIFELRDALTHAERLARAATAGSARP